MKTTLIAVLVSSAVALGVGFGIGYHSGYRAGGISCMAGFRLESDGRFVLQEPAQPRGNGHQNSYPDPVAADVRK
jgi:hypothetical protein